MAVKPEISKSWWVKQKFKQKTDMDKALGSAEDALKAAEKKGDADAFKQAILELAKLKKTIEKTQKDAKKSKDDELTDILNQINDLVDEKTEELEESHSEACEKGEEGAEGEEGEVDDVKLLEPDHQIKMVRILRSGKELNFCFGMDRQSPEASKLILDRKKKPERLHQIVKMKLGIQSKLISFGRAAADGKILIFNLDDDSNEPSQIIKIARRFLKKNPELKFKKLRVVTPGGQAVEGDLEAEDQEGQEAPGGAPAGDLQQRLKSAETAAATWTKTRDSVADQIAELKRELDAFDDPDVQSVRKGLDGLLDHFHKLDLNALAKSSDPAAFSSQLEKTRTGIADWRKLIGPEGAFMTIDENPFNVQTHVVSLVGEALNTIASELKIA
jgi:hypothetical protein